MHVSITDTHTSPHPPGNLRDAERLYLTVGEADKAIFMYKKEGRFEDMIRLVSKHRKELLTETHLHLAQQLEGQVMGWWGWGCEWVCGCVDVNVNV